MRRNIVLVLIGLAALFYLSFLLRSQREVETITGQPRVIDGDTIEIARRRIRIFGIDAPEQDQTCERGGGGTWNCGAEATRLMRQMARAQIVDCRVRATDVYGRLVALCTIGDEDLGRAMVRSGFAINVARNGAYTAEENIARAGRLGIWSGTFQNPKEWRDVHRDTGGQGD
jgi:endonuclease YncB( thermonuclease family)